MASPVLDLGFAIWMGKVRCGLTAKEDTDYYVRRMSGLEMFCVQTLAETDIIAESGL